MVDILLNSDKLNAFFKGKGYRCVKPYSIVNNNDTVFVSAGIQPLLRDYREGKINSQCKVYVSQPVIRTQYSAAIDEGSSIAFTNLTSANFNHSETEHYEMVKHWYELLYELGVKKDDLSSKSDIYKTKWGDLSLYGERTFHYYKGVEIGDTTFFTKIFDETSISVADTMSDLGFGLERLRWLINGNSYYNIYSDSQNLNVELKAYLSVISLLAVNNVKPSNKNTGYRARKFSKELVTLLNGRSLDLEEKSYLDECIRYWKHWQKQPDFHDSNIIINEFVRNGNRYIINQLSAEGIDNLSGIDINISRNELRNRLINSGVDQEKIKKLIR